MAASISFRVYTGNNAAIESLAQDGVSFLSIDSAATDPTTCRTNPVVAGTPSYEKHLRFKVDVAPSYSVGNFKVWTASSAVANVGLVIKGAVGTSQIAQGATNA